jgi:cellulose synthase/poly-beta-1,6-N-acetylglucosamine synthase-like glycosyltransferase
MTSPQAHNQLEFSSASVGTPLSLATIINRAPLGWAENSLPSLKLQASDPTHAWTTITACNPRESRFAVCLPVHNEEQSVRIALSGLMHSLLPVQGNVTVYIIANACEDNSATEIREFFTSLGPCEVVSVPETLDAGLNSHGLKYNKDGITFFALETKTPGKPSAQTLVTRLAQRDGYRLMISVDADTVVEPDALARMYASWRLDLECGEAGHKLIFGRREKVVPAGLLNPILKFLIARGEGTWAPQQISGKLMAWDCEWLLSIGGVPKMPSEDYALAVLAKRDGIKIQRSDGRTWANACGNFSDLAKHWIRWGRSVHQMKATFDDTLTKQAIEDFFPETSGTFGSRLRRFIGKQFSRPSFNSLIAFSAREILLFLGHCQLSRQKNPEVWKTGKSTKL